MPNAVGVALRRRGIDVLTAAEAGLLGAPEEEVLARSLADGRVLVTQDRDFLRLHREQHPHAGIAYSQRGTRTIAQLLTGLVLIYDVLEPDGMTGRVEYL